MSLEICILASGSAGNCTVIRTPAGIMLIDIGMGPRTTEQRLRGTGVSIDSVQAVCLTHLDRDHFRPSWVRTLIDRGIRLFCHGSRVAELLNCVESFAAGQVRPLPTERLASLVHQFSSRPFTPLPGLEVRPIHLAHDEAGSHGFLIEGHGRRLGYATDLGKVPDHLFDHFDNLDILALESNYDRDMQLASSRPRFLKQRIMGGAGHLSNDQALAAVQQILDRAQSLRRCLPQHIVLLHRSQECNCPKLLRRLFIQDPRIAPRLTLADQHHRSPWLRPTNTPAAIGEQLTLSWT